MLIERTKAAVTRIQQAKHKEFYYLAAASVALGLLGLYLGYYFAFVNIFVAMLCFWMRRDLVEFDAQMDAINASLDRVFAMLEKRKE